MKPKVFTIIPGDKGSDWIRIIQPFSYLRQNGIPAIAIPEGEKHKLALTGLPDYNILVIPRRVPGLMGLHGIATFIEIEQARGIKVVYEIDDDPFSQRFYKDRGAVEAVLTACDAAVASTPYLARKIAPFVKTYVFRNYVDEALWSPYPRPPHDDIVIGISGSPTHYEDWLLAKDALYRVAAKHSHVRFVTFGYTPDYLRDLPRLTVLDPVPYLLYPRYLKRFDIGLAPLVIDPEGFNLCKSPIKALDYMMAGAAALASDHPVYRQIEGCRRVKDDEWFDVLDYYILNPTELDALKTRGERWTRKNRTLRTGWKELARAYSHILKENRDDISSGLPCRSG
jgi:glycosyltransferase involved in cell wall biosynthesis